MHVFRFFHTVLEEIFLSMKQEGIFPKNLSTSHFSVERPKNAEHGDITTNAAMVLCKQAKMPPRELAKKIVEHLEKNSTIKTIDIAGPGFINMHLSEDFWYQSLETILEQGVDYGNSTLGNNEKVNLEYVSVNPTGPLHVGHARGAVLGDVLAALLKKCNYQVIREYYVNDSGAQINALAHSLYIRYCQALKQTDQDVPEGLYPGEYLIPIAETLVQQDGDKWIHKSQEERMNFFRQYAVETMMEIIKDDLKTLGVHHDIFVSEDSLIKNDYMKKVLDSLEQRDLIYTGVLEPPKGKADENWEPRPQKLFRSTLFGDTMDRPLVKPDGTHTYFASDIAYHYNKFERGFKKMIDVLGADHGGYVKRMLAATEAFSQKKASLDILQCQIVRFFDNGKPVRMSKRAGQFITMREVVNTIGKDVFRFMMLTRKNDAQLDFDFQKVQEQSKDNPVFYVQYAHARICSVLRHAQKEFPENMTEITELKKADFSLLKDQNEIKLIRLMAEWPHLVESAAQKREAHRVVFYLQDVAAVFHALWNKGKEKTELRFLLQDNLPLTRARLALLQALAFSIQSGLDIVGIKATEEM